MVVKFDVDADIIDVPQFVIDNREVLRRRFLKWLSSKNTNHKYWRKWTSSSGLEIWGLQYRSDAFVEWLNKKVLCNAKDKAVILQEKIWEYPEDLPFIFF